MSEEEREWVECNLDLSYEDRLVSDEDKAVIEAFLSDEEFLTSMVKQGFSTDGIRGIMQ